MKKIVLLTTAIIFISLTGCKEFFGTGQGVVSNSSDLRGTEWVRETPMCEYEKKVTKGEAITIEVLALEKMIEKISFGNQKDEQGVYHGTYSRGYYLDTVQEDFSTQNIDGVEIEFSNYRSDDDQILGDYFISHPYHGIHLFCTKTVGFNKGIPSNRAITIEFSYSMSTDEAGQIRYLIEKKSRTDQCLVKAHEAIIKAGDLWTLDESKLQFKTIHRLEASEPVPLLPTKEPINYYNFYYLEKINQQERLYLKLPSFRAYNFQIDKNEPFYKAN